MKQNAILIAAIMFISAGCAHQGTSASRSTGTGDGMDPAYRTETYVSDSGMNRGEELTRTSTGKLAPTRPMDPPTALEHDPAYIKASSSSGDADHDWTKSSAGVKADSSIRGGSNQARGFDFSGNKAEPAPSALDSRVQANSALRGGSNEARGQGWRYNDPNETEGAVSTHQGIKADSSIRGGSNRARGFDVQKNSWDSPRSSAHPGSPAMQEDIVMENSTPDWESHYDAGASASFESDANLSTNDDNDSSESNIASQDGTAWDSNARIFPEVEDPYHRTERSFGEEVEDLAGVGSGSIGNNSRPVTDSPEDLVDAEERLRNTLTEGRDLFENNPAQGIGAPARFQSESINSSQSSAQEDAQTSDNDLASRVKARLTSESTGVFGPSQEEMRNITVSSEGGKVTLKGAVSSEDQKRIIGIRAREMKGVQSVDNQLTVSADASASSRDEDPLYNRDQQE